MKKRMGIVAAVATAMLCSSFAFAAPIKIGLMAPITGAFASEGQDMQKICELMTEELNKAGVIIAVQSGTTGETYCRENFPNATIQPYGNSTDSFAAMQAGQATAVCTNAAVVKKMLSEAYSDAQVVIEVATGEEYAVAVNKDNPELTKAINEAIKKLQDDGTVEKLAAKWLG